MSTQFSENGNGSISRRSVIKAAAWAAPVVAVAVAAPLASASTGPQPVGPGSNAELDGGVSIGTYRGGNPNEVRVNQTAAGFGFYIFDSNGDEYPDGTYQASTPTITVSWSASASYTPVLQNLRGWTQVGGSTAAGTSGSISFTYAGPFLNGATNRIPAPYVVLRPTTGNSLPTASVTARATAQYFDAISQTIDVI